MTCGGGQRSRGRSCETGKNCEGPLDEVDACSLNRCPGKNLGSFLYPYFSLLMIDGIAIETI